MRPFTNYLAYWLIYPFTLLESALMLLAAGISHGIWRTAYSALWYPQAARQRPRGMVKQKMDAQDALAVMLVVERMGRDSGAGLFWLSGTLLGLTRLGQPLPHDTDLDAGLFIDDPRRPDFIRALQASGKVVLLKPQTLSLKTRIQNPDLHVVPGGVIRYTSMVRSADAPHSPVVKTDIFLHFRYRGGWMHGTRNSLWWNSPFEVIQQAYGGHRFSVPADAPRHLTENYGDYRSEVKEFENSIDCPNAMNIFSWISLIYLLRRQHVMLKLGRIHRAWQINARIGRTVLKGVYPVCMRRPRATVGS
jgi:hypothetical protein